jgi:hypothetical protein
MGDDWIDIDRTAALENVGRAQALKLKEILGSGDFIGRLVIALPIGADVATLDQTIKDALADHQFDALSENLKSPLPFNAWVRSFATLWEEKLHQAGLTPAASQLANTLMQLLSAMLEV